MQVYLGRYVRVGDHDIPAEDEAPLADTFQVDYYIHHARCRGMPGARGAGPAH